MLELDFWNTRYKTEGCIWLDKPSLTALLISETLLKGAKVIEAGFGYGRDALFLAKAGYQVTAVEKSAEGLKMAKDKSVLLNFDHKPKLLKGDFLDVPLPAHEYDVAYCHRVIHLFTCESEIKEFVKKVAWILKPGALLFVSARDPRGVKPKRNGHEVAFWDEKRFRREFEGAFQIQEFIQGSEIESAANPVQTFFTLMIAEKKRSIVYG